MLMVMLLKRLSALLEGKGLDVADLVVEDGYIYAETKTAGVPAKDIVTDMLPQLITGLNFPKSMSIGVI